MVKIKIFWRLKTHLTVKRCKIMFQLIQQQFSLLLLVFLLTIALSLILTPVANKLSLVDKPNDRKNHQNVTPVIGGICIFLACGIASFVFGNIQSQDIRSLVVAASLFLCLGVLDDLFDFKASIKLMTQVTFSFVFIVSTGLQISSIGYPFGLTNSFELGFLSTPFTLLAVIGLTNAVNMIDGCDGLAASLITLALLALLYFGSSHFVLAKQIVLLMLVTSVMTFLLFNFSNNPARKVFLGDGGSLFLGFVVSVFLVNFAEGNETYSPSIVLWFVAVPVFDFCAVVVRRLLLQRKIMSADRSHIHHYLLSFGLSHFQTTVVVLLTAIALLCLGIFLEANYPSLSQFTFIGLFMAYLLFRMLSYKRQ